MAERSFAREVQDLKLGDGEEFRGEGILAITKALLQSGVSYVGGYQGAPANAPGMRHLAFAVEDIDAVLARLQDRGAELVGELGRYRDSYRLCYVRGPDGIIVELAQRIG